MVLFDRNTITTNGTVPLVDFGPEVLYVVSLDGPEDVNDALRGEGTHRRVLRNLDRLPPERLAAIRARAAALRSALADTASGPPSDP